MPLSQSGSEIVRLRPRSKIRPGATKGTEWIVSLTVISVVVFLYGSVLIGFAKFPRRKEDLMGTFAHTLPPPGVEIDSILNTKSVFHYCTAICIGVAYSFRANVASTLEKLLFKIIVETYNGASINRNMRIIEGDSALDQAWDYVMARAQCCGIHDYTEFRAYSKRWNPVMLFHGSAIDAHVPLMCCKMEDPTVVPYNIGKLSFINFGKCVKYGNEKYINIRPCYSIVYSDIFSLSKKYDVLAFISMLLDVPCLIIGGMMWYIHYKSGLKRAAFREERLEWLTMIADLAITFITNGAAGYEPTKADKDAPIDSEVLDPDTSVVVEGVGEPHAEMIQGESDAAPGEQ